MEDRAPSNAAAPSQAWTLSQIVDDMTPSNAVIFTPNPVPFAFYEDLPGANMTYIAFSQVTELNAAQKDAAREIFSLIADVTNLTFAETAYQLPPPGSLTTANSGSIVLQNDGNDGTYGGFFIESGDGHRGRIEQPSIFVAAETALGDYSPGSANFNELLNASLDVVGVTGAYYPGGSTYWNDAKYVADSQQFSITSPFSAAETGASHQGAFGATPLLLDIVALQSLYGVNTSTRSGDTVYGFNSNAGRESFDFTQNSNPVVAIWDGGGRDTLDLSGYADDTWLDLREGAFSDAGGLTFNIAIALGAVIEDGVAGAGDDVVVGNGVANRLQGGAGDDVISAGGGDDTVAGGPGNDRLDGGAGRDTLDYTGASTSVVGNAATGWVATGDGFYDQVTGMEVWRLGSGNDTLITWAGQEIVYGGGGRDWIGDYGVNQNNIFYGEDGDDSLYGLGGSDVLWGGTGADFLVGGDGADYIIGGAGIDWMDGQGGADTFFIYALSEIQGGWEAIANFQSGVDKLNVQYIDADGNAGNGDTAFTVTTTGFTNTAGQIYIERPGGQNYAFVRFDTNGDSVADALLFVTGTALTSADFIL